MVWAPGGCALSLQAQCLGPVVSTWPRGAICHTTGTLGFGVSRLGFPNTQSLQVS